MSLNINRGEYVFKDTEEFYKFLKTIFEVYDTTPSDPCESSFGGFEFTEREWEHIKGEFRFLEESWLIFDREDVEEATKENGSLDLIDLISDSSSAFNSIGVSKAMLNRYDGWVKPLDVKAGDFLTNSSNLPTFKIREVDYVSSGKVYFTNGGSFTLGDQSRYWKILPKDEVVKAYKENESRADVDTQEFYTGWVANQKKTINDHLDDHYGIQDSQETTKMSKVKQAAAAAVTANKTAGIEAAKLKVGKTANNLATKMLKPKLPMGFKGAAEHPLFKVAIANAASIAVQQVAGNNPKALAVSEAMMTAAYLEFMDKFDIEAMLDEILGNFKGTAVDKITDAKAQEIVIDE